MDGWNTTFLLGRPIFRGEPLVSGRVSIHFREGIPYKATFEDDFPFPVASRWCSSLAASPSPSPYGRSWMPRHRSRQRLWPIELLGRWGRVGHFAWQKTPGLTPNRKKMTSTFCAHILKKNENLFLFSVL